MDPTLFTQSRLLRVNDYDEVRESVNQPRQEQQPGDRCPRHVARIIAENDPPIRCDLTLQELLSEVQVDFEPSASEVVAMEGLMDEQHFIPHDPHSKKAAGPNVRHIDIVTAAASMSGISGSTERPLDDGQRPLADGCYSKKHKKQKHSEPIDTKVHIQRGEETDSDSDSDTGKSPGCDEISFYLSSASDDEHGNGNRSGLEGNCSSYTSHSSRRSKSPLRSPSNRPQKRKLCKNMFITKSKRRVICESDSDTDSEIETRPFIRPQEPPRQKNKGKRCPKKHRKIKELMDGPGFVAPNAHKRGKNRNEGNNDGRGKPTTRALEYKQMPYKQQTVQFLYGNAIRTCRESTVHDKIIMVMFTRGQDIRQAIEKLRSQLGQITNLSISAPFNTEHTKPQIHTPNTVNMTSQALAAGLQASWNLDEDNKHNNAPRMSDYRTMIIQAATPPDFLGALKLCIQFAQTFPKNACIRLCNIVGGLQPLPIYEKVVTAYTDTQYNFSPITNKDSNGGMSTILDQDSDSE
ncbi:immediate early protein 2 [Rat cytomegalovirus ALL-03]|uniref:Immediate early protein 2 n=5 Tax=Muromegalovirus TaxID=10365 RepID=A0A0F6R4C4_RCMVE|nr:immediate early protein 2 [Murid betaherpesvirus 8]AAB92266.1 immediate early protein 2 [Murid betaherpesvirus 2]AKE44283.1 immediate early protein 2 [Rat cytomegalovirus ALL-03]AFX83432.1 immediate early protein 2 [Murid betaherpesvirus 8]WEG71904.1 regulatory protein IE2 [Murid betaherpesvirus 8]WPH25294.1 regulatory protein IE2 [Murid betaherpesvirus 8]